MSNIDLIHTLRQEADYVITEMLKNFDEEPHEGAFPDYVFWYSLHKFSLEFDFNGKAASIRTFHLRRDERIHGQYNKIEVPEASVSISIGGEGQLKYFLGGSGIGYIPNEFVQSHLKKHYKAVVDFTDNFDKSVK